MPTIPCVQEWLALLESNDQIWDQNAFNDLFRRGVKFDSERPDRLFL